METQPQLTREQLSKELREAREVLRLIAQRHMEEYCEIMNKIDRYLGGLE